MKLTIGPIRGERQPCPFCGQQDMEDEDGDRVLAFDAGSRCIICLTCDAEGPAGDGSKWNAEQLWNNRAQKS